MDEVRSVLFGLEGFEVLDAVETADGLREVTAVGGELRPAEVSIPEHARSGCPAFRRQESRRDEQNTR